MPTAVSEHLASSVAYAVQRVHLDEAWPGFLPAHIGHSPMLDFAATALVKAHDHAAGKYTGSATSSLRPYTEAMSRLRVAIASPERALREETAITVGLLALVEHLLTPETRWPRPVARGDVQPAVYKLRWMSHQLFLRLPTLIVLVRKLREFADVNAAEEAVKLAGTLLEICDDDVEIEFVRSLRTTEILYDQDRTIKRASFQFDNTAQYFALLYYSQTRLLLFRLCRVLSAVSPATDLLDTPTPTIARMVENLFRSWQYTLITGVVGDHAVFMAIVAAWASLTDHPHLLEPELHAHELRIWLLGILNSTLTNQAADCRELDQLADLFAGGPITGSALVRRYTATRRASES
ncbi:hypothetical protein LTR56_004653 [Elasticomyces elasticus]|nr:hypothetical protein LTR22_019894 [Elasticomyces elasticus]KAK3653449.1 hypothetical protein LTR56_004653 [Elasticomyces elasticus]KAK4925993.1 hypothetical protein LTR49_007131 [Elasticomyces elasticus]KAK5768229.1 hypothetical protein LTS12_001713 [Elasticomyces elasticus]